MGDRRCTIPGCEGRYSARGYCNKHYLRARVGKDPAQPTSLDLTIEQRFWRKVDRNGPDGCWLWTRGTDDDGYGIFGTKLWQAKAHRWSYELLVGPIPQGLVIDHLCRIHACVNPEHLEPVTDKTNTLRGFSPAAKNAVKTHCKRGHEFTDANTGLHRNGRFCRICKRESDLQHYYRKSRAAA
jgi:hypothetical protein